MATQKTLTLGVKYYTSQYSGCVDGGRGQSSNLPYGLPHETNKNNFVEQGYIVFDNTTLSGLSTACELVSSRFSAAHSNNGSATLDTVVAAFFSRFTKTSVSGTKAVGSAEAWGSASGTGTSEVFSGTCITDNVSQKTTHNISGTTTATSSYPNSRKFFGDSAIHIAYRLYARYTNGTTLPTATRHDYLSGISVTITYNAKCYITFQGDGITTKKSVYDYGATPSFGSTPTRTGYTFKGWKSGSTTYTGALPTAGETDVTYTAVWEKQKFYFDLNGWIDGVSSGGISPAGTANVYINGELVGRQVADYYQQHPQGSTYEIRDINSENGYVYVGVKSGSLKGTITANTSVVLEFKSVPLPEVTAVSMTYGSQPVSRLNRVPIGEGFLISVQVSVG